MFLLLTAILLFGGLVSCVPIAETDGVQTVGVCGDYIDYGRINSAEAVSGNITNLVIFIYFKDETIPSNTIINGVTGYFDAEDDSLQDYYSTVSYGIINVNTIYPDTDYGFFVYQASYARSYYKSITEKTAAATRYKVESELLNGAVNAADEYFEYAGLDLDVNNDNYVDCVSFLVSGTYNSADASSWGGLLWPHSWNLDDITKAAKGTTGKLSDIKVNRYSFNFIETVNTGLVCHETGHVLGMPDLYHYDRDRDYIQVGMWDIMHNNHDTPQYPTVYMRDKYLKAIGINQIVDISTSGTFTLKPVSSATAEDVVAYRLKINDDESIWFEYRNKDAATYDSGLPGSGLIVYRTNSLVSGNEKGRYQSTQFPDEVYIYRPNVSKASDRRTNEINNLAKAYLNPDNPYFNTLGNKTSTEKYDDSAIFLTNGQNTGVSLKVDSISDEILTFTIDTNGYGNAEISDIYIEGDNVINYGETPNITVKIKVSGFSGYVKADPSKYTVYYDPELLGTQTATVIYDIEGGEPLVKSFQLTINDKIAANGAALLTNPNRTQYDVGDIVDLSGLSIKISYVSGAVITAEYTTSNANNWKVTGLDMKKSGVYDAKISYLPFDVYVYVTFNVMTQLKSIYVSEKNSLTVLDSKENLVLNVMGKNSDGTERVLSAEEINISEFSKTVLYTAQQITIRSKADSSIYCQRTVYVTEKDALSALETESLPNKTIYKFGEELNLTGGKLRFVYNNGVAISVPTENYYNLFDEYYSATKKGRQSLSTELYGRILTLEITMLTSDSSVLVSSSENIIINHLTGNVVLKETSDLSELEQTISTYLSGKIRYIYLDGAIEYEVRSNTHPDLKANSSMRIELRNSSGQVILKFKIYVLGDTNGDGIADNKDIDGWADALFRNLVGSAVYLDMNGDGLYNLTDFVLLNEKYGRLNAD